MKTLSIAALVTLLTLTQGGRSFAVQTTIDFESFPTGPFTPGPLNIQYGSLGVTFNYPPSGNVPRILSTAGYPLITPHSGTYYVVGPDFGVEFGDTDLRIQFASPQSMVQLYGGTNCVGGTGTLRAFANGLPVGTLDAKALATGSVSTLFVVTTTTPQITEVSFRATLTPTTGCLEAIDDLLIDGDPPPTAGNPPTIVLEHPLPGNHDYTFANLVAIGSAQGTNLFSLELVLTHASVPQGLPLPKEHFFPPLTQTTGTVPFNTVLQQMGKVAIGKYNVLASVNDVAGRTAQATVDISYFPPPLDTDQGLGPFRFGVTEGNCQIAFYEGGALAFRQSSLPLVFIPTAIAEKWRTVNSPILGPSRTLGCPIGDSNTVFTWAVQDFERGRVYVPATGNASYVPTVLGQAIRELSHNETIFKESLQVGWPVADPEWYLDAADPVWVFQRFAQNNLGPAYWNTLEIRGRSPTLYVERIGGDIAELMAAGFQSGGNPVVDSRTPTQWQEFPCNTPSGGNQWPTACNLSTILHPPYPTTGLDLGTFCGGGLGCDLQNACDNSTQCPTLYPGTSTPAWNDTIPDQNYDPVAYEGIIRTLDLSGPSPGSHLANTDYPFNHDHCTQSNGIAGVITLEEIGIALENVGACTIGLLFGACTETVGANCRSDWNLHTRPLPELKNWGFLSRHNIFPGPSITADFEIEWEAEYTRQFLREFEPTIGDLVFVHGRRIVDCGHCPYNAEIHPPDVVVDSRSFVERPYSNRDEVRTTDAYLWVNGFFPNLLTVPVTVRAPPRPSLHSRMQVSVQEPGYYAYVPGTPGLNGELEFRAGQNLVVGGNKIVFAQGKPGFNSKAPVDSSGDKGQWHYPEGESPFFVDNWRLSWVAR